MQKVIIIILNWNGLTDTLECLESVMRQDYRDFEIIVVDNASNDDSPAIIRRTFPQITFIQNEKNMGFAKGNNIGINKALVMQAEYIWLLNNDTVVEKDTLSKLVETIGRSPEIGMASPVIYFYENPEEVQFCGSYIDWKRKSIIKYDRIDASNNERSISLWGTALLIKRTVIEKVGYLNEKYFAYHEDEDYSIRVTKAGYKNVIATNARIFHKNSRSTGSNDAPFQVFLRSRNIYFLWKDNLIGMDKWFQFNRYLAHIISYGSGLKEKNLADSYTACMDGVWHAFLGEGGTRNPNIKMPKFFKVLLDGMISWHPYFWSCLFRGDFRKIFSAVNNNFKIRFYR